jgi:hypothetical protein
MSQDKGFGLATGQHATQILAQEFKKAGYDIYQGQSPWHLDDEDYHELIKTLRLGIAQACTAQITSQYSVATSLKRSHIQDWQEHAATSAVIGHTDFWTVHPE